MNYIHSCKISFYKFNVILFYLNFAVNATHSGCCQQIEQAVQRLHSFCRNYVRASKKMMFKWSEDDNSSCEGHSLNKIADSPIVLRRDIHFCAFSFSIPSGKRIFCGEAFIIFFFGKRPKQHYGSCFIKAIDISSLHPLSKLFTLSLTEKIKRFSHLFLGVSRETKSSGIPERPRQQVSRQL